MNRDEAFSKIYYSLDVKDQIKKVCFIIDKTLTPEQVEEVCEGLDKMDIKDVHNVMTERILKIHAINAKAD